MDLLECRTALKLCSKSLLTFPVNADTEICLPAGAGAGAGTGIGVMEHGRHHTPGTQGSQSGYGTGELEGKAGLGLTHLLVPVRVTLVGLLRWRIACVVKSSGATSTLLTWAAGIDHKCNVHVSLVTTGASSGTGNDNRTMGEKVKDALPGTGRGSSTTGGSSGQGYTQEGATPGTGQPLDACPAGLASCASAQLYWL